MAKEKAICKHCGKSFSYYRSTLRGKDAKFCSRKCYIASHPKAWNKGKIEYSECLYCGKQVRGWRKYCSQKCFKKDVDVSKHLPKVGTGKDNPFFGKKHTKKSKLMMVNSYKIRHPNWDGGISYPERTRFNNTIRSLILERDDYTCQMCGERGGKLQVDHIKNWCDHEDLRFDVDNCRTLCMACHYEVTYGRKMSNTIKNWGLGSKQKPISLQGVT